jgi:hypothetical protein
MKERASAPGGCWKLHASVSTRLGGPYVRSLRRPGGRRNGPAPAPQRAGADDRGWQEAGDHADHQQPGGAAPGDLPGGEAPQVVLEATCRGHITKQGSPVVRWALIEAIQHVPAGHPLRQRKEDILARRGDQARHIAKVAAARQLLTWVFYAMRDGQVRALATATSQAA